MKKVLLTILRNKKTDIAQFRKAGGKLALILAGEVSEYLEKETVKIETPVAPTQGQKIKNNIILVPILRAALCMLPPFLKFFENAKVGFMGLKRDEKDVTPKMYYKNLPKISATDDIIILDPMIASGGSGSKTIEVLKKNGVAENKIIFVAIICLSSGLEKIKKEYPKVKIIFVEQDKELNRDHFITPGLGDFGDRFFGT